jgi:hypothetical protein
MLLGAGNFGLRSGNKKKGRNLEGYPALIVRWCAKKTGVRRGEVSP